MIDNIRWKFVAAAAILAMAVSLLSGGLGGIRFGVLMTRALIGGVVFAALAIGLNLLVARVFPEILEDGDVSSVAADTGGETPGSRVDIVMPSEAPEFTGGREDSADLSGHTETGDNVSSDDEDSSEVELPGDDSGNEPDELGDLDRFSGDFAGSDDDDSYSDRSRSEGPGSEHDPEELAQAIQTVIKRDEKG